MKKKLFAFAILITQLYLVGQTSIINFKYAESKFKWDFKKDSVYKLELALVFPGEFKGKQIYILDSVKSPNFIIKLTFGKDADVPYYAGKDEFRIVIDSNKVITGLTPKELQGISIKQNGFYVRIANEVSDLIKITSSFKKETKHLYDYIPGHVLYDAIYISDL
ncbi:MAG TPA: hypothetical protein VN026_10295, partial [Bacteroidia bacterium]|nr:hypothetical protein [Bacteroidia bacterium]